MNVDLLEVAKICVAIVMVAATLGFVGLIVGGVVNAFRGESEKDKGGE